MEGNNNLILRTEHLTKRFGKLVAVDDLNLEIHRGEVFGFLGPNGAGKSTTMGMILGLITPTAGKVEVFGLDIRSHLPKILRRVGAVTENPGFYPYLSGRDNLNYIARITGEIGSQRIDQILELVELAGRDKDAFSNYSLGMKQRLAIASALLHDPEFIILDEPTNGLDPAGMKEIRELIAGLGREGKTIFLNSHLLHEVEQVCERVAIIKQGKMIMQDLVKDLLKRGDIVQIKVSEPERAITILERLDWITSVARDEDNLLVGVAPKRSVEISAALAKENIFIAEMKAKEETLESFFLRITGGEDK